MFPENSSVLLRFGLHDPKNMLFLMLKAEWLHQVLYSSEEHHNFRQKIIILFRKYFVDIRSEAWLIFWGGINKWRIVCSVARQPSCTEVRKYTVSPSYLGKLVLRGIQSPATGDCLRTSSLPSPLSMA
jgi:hypothetical protein